MKLTLISEEFKSNLKNNILKVLKGNEEILEVDCLYPSIVVDCLEDIGVDIDLGDSMDTNGWDWDYWIKFKYENKRYCLSGSGYYGGLKIYRDTDSEEEEDDDEYNEDVSDMPNEQSLKNIVELLKQADDILNKE